jgi:hypothetical protein
MNWRRGLLLAGIHFVAAGSLIAWKEALEWPYLRHSKSLQQNLAFRLVAWQEDQTITFDPCGFWRSIPLQVTVAQIGELPAAILTGWGADCPDPRTLYGILHQGPAKNTPRERMIVLAAFVILIPLQWLAIGGFPLNRPRRWWIEPGAFITAYMVGASLFVFIPPLSRLVQILAIFPSLAWLCWLALLVFKSIRFGRRKLHRVASPTSRAKV